MDNSNNIIKRENDKNFIKKSSDRELQEVIWTELRSQNDQLSQINNSNKIISIWIQILGWLTTLSVIVYIIIATGFYKQFS